MNLVASWLCQPFNALAHRLGSAVPGMIKLDRSPVIVIGLSGAMVGGLGAIAPVAIAQVIPSSDQTEVRPNPSTGTDFEITGGSVSNDGANLFHDFRMFNLDRGAVANFTTEAVIDRILATISGGSPSLIDGVLRVTGSQADLYLLNPAGLIFGENAQLDVPGSFWAMTADRVAFGDRELNVFGSNDYGSLVGTPTGFGFSPIAPAAITNFATLETPSGGVGLVGGTVASRGDLSAADAVQIVSVPGSHWLRLEVPGQVLGLEFEPMAIAALASADAAITPRSLSDLLVGTMTAASEIVVAADGTVSLTGARAEETLAVKPGDVAIAASSITANEVQINADRNLIATTSTINAETTAALVANDTTTIRDSPTTPFRLTSGNSTLIQGDRDVDIFTLNFVEPAFQVGGNLFLVSNGSISGDARFVSGGSITFLDTAGMPGTFISRFDPILRATGDVFFDTYSGASLKLETGGGIVGSTIIIDRPDLSLANDPDPDAALLSSTPTLILRAETSLSGTANNIDLFQFGFSPGRSTITEGISVGAIATAGGPVLISAVNDITLGQISTSGGEVEVVSQAGGLLLPEGIDTSNTSTSSSAGGEVRLRASGDIQDLGLIDTRGQLQGGNVAIASTNGILGFNTIGTAITTEAIAGAGGNVTLDFSDRLTVPSIVTQGSIAGGDITINADQVIFDTTTTFPMLNTTSSQGTGGTVAITTNGVNVPSTSTSTTTNPLIRVSGNRQGGTITIQSSRGLNLGNTSLDATSANGTGGVINLDIGFTDGAEPIRIGDLRASGATGGQVTIDLATGDLELDTGNPSGLTIDVRGLNGVGGSVDLNAPENIAVDTIQATGTAGGGRVAIASDVGGYTGDTINASAATSGAGGSITINVGFGIELLGDLIADGITRGGTITLNSLGAIEAQRLSAQASSSGSGSGGGSGGSVRLANQTDITLGSINVQGGANGTGGSVAIDSSTLQLFGIFTDRQGQNASISAAGGAGPGSIQIDNAAITNGVPFTIGSVNNGNGSAGVLTTGGDTLPNGTIVAEPLLLDTIRINQSTPTPTPSPEPSPSPSPEPTPTPSPEPSPTPSPEPTPTPSPEPSPEPSPTPSPEPTPSPSPSPGPRTDREDQQIAIDLAPSKPGNTPPPNNIQASDRFTPLRRSQIDQFLDAGQVYKALALLDAEMSNEFIQYLRLRDVNTDGSSSSGNAEDNISIEAIQLAQAELLTAQNATGTVPAMVYMFADTDRLSIIVVPSEGQPIYHSVAVDRDTLIAATNDLQNSLINARLRRTNSHLIPARQLYDWLIAPVRDDLVRLGIDNLIFALDSGFRGLPIAALHDGDRYLVEDFAIGLIPSVSLVDFTPKNLRDAPVLAMGASEFTDLSALPAVPFEVEFISTLSSGRSFLNDEFTLKNVIDQRDTYPAPILHLATHAEFSAGELSNSYIQLWDRKLSLDRIRELNLNDPAVEMMVLSACRTAIGNEDAELGFAGMAVQSGVKSVVASLWYVSDAGTLSLMSQFYEAIHSAPTRAFALREAQLAMLRGEVVVQDGQLVTSRGSISVPDNLNLGTSDFSNPYYWAAFTMIGSPW